jgi:hypothetical protein
MARHDLGDELMDNPNFPLQSAEDIAWSVAYRALTLDFGHGVSGGYAAIDSVAVALAS